MRAGPKIAFEAAHPYPQGKLYCSIGHNIVLKAFSTESRTRPGLEPASNKHVRQENLTKKNAQSFDWAFSL